MTVPAADADDRALLERCLRGEPAGWEEFVRRYHAVIEGAVRFTFLRAVHSVPAADVENAVQDLYARLYEENFRRLRTFEGRCPLAAWLKSLAVRHALNAVRDEKRRGRFGGGALDDLPLAAAEGSGDADPAEREQIRRLDFLLDQLGSLPRAVLKMFYYDGLSYRQISATLDIPVQTIGSLVSRARARLRELMGTPDEAQ